MTSLETFSYEVAGLGDSFDVAKKILNPIPDRAILGYGTLATHLEYIRALLQGPYVIDWDADLSTLTVHAGIIYLPCCTKGLSDKSDDREWVATRIKDMVRNLKNEFGDSYFDPPESFDTTSSLLGALVERDLLREKQESDEELCPTSVVLLGSIFVGLVGLILHRIGCYFNIHWLP